MGALVRLPFPARIRRAWAICGEDRPAGCRHPCPRHPQWPSRLCSVVSQFPGLILEVSGEGICATQTCQGLQRQSCPQTFASQCGCWWATADRSACRAAVPAPRSGADCGGLLCALLLEPLLLDHSGIPPASPRDLRSGAHLCLSGQHLVSFCQILLQELLSS